MNRFLPFILKNAAKHSTLKSRGFTLLEVVVVTVMLSIILAFAAPMVARQLRSIALKNVVYQCVGDLQLIKSQAIRTQANCQATFNVGLNRYTLSDPNRTVDFTIARGNVTFTANPDGNTDVFSPIIAFTPRGVSALIPPGPTQIYITNRDNRIFRVQASAAGAISFREWSPGTNSWQ